MKKLSRLIWVLRKCGRANNEDESANNAVGDTSSLIMIMVIVALVGAMFFAGRYLGEHQDVFGDGDSIFSTIMMVAALTALFFSIPRMINQLYMSGDLDILVTMPFTPMQIVAAKLVNASSMPLAICCGFVIPTGIGFGITAGSTGILYWVGLLLSGLLLSITACSLAGLLVIVVMRLFRRIRSRNMIAVMTSLFAFGFTVAYFVVSGSSVRIDEQQLTGIFQIAEQSMGGVARVIPMIDLTTAAMFNRAAWYQLPLAIAATGAAVALLLLAAKYLYFSAALGMQDSNAARSKLSDVQMEKATRAVGASRAMMRREFRTVIRMPAMINNGFLQSFVVPLLVLVPMGMRISSEGFSQSSMAEVIPGLPAGMLIIVMEMITAVFISISVGTSSLSSGIISREGKDYYTLKAMPVKMRSVVAAKIKVAALINAIPAVGYAAILAIVGTVEGILPLWSVAVVLGFGIPFLVTMVCFCALGDVRKPNLNWENEADVCKSNNRGIILFAAVLLGSVGAFVLLIECMPSDSVMLLIGFAILAANLVGAALCYRGLMKSADELAKQF